MGNHELGMGDAINYYGAGTSGLTLIYPMTPIHNQSGPFYYVLLTING